MTAPSAKRIPALLLVLLSIVAAFAIYDSTRARIDRRDSTLHSPTASVRPTASVGPTGARPPVTRPPTGAITRATGAITRATGTTPTADRPQSESGDPVRTVLTIALITVAGIIALTLAVLLIVMQVTRRRGAGPPLA